MKKFYQANKKDIPLVTKMMAASFATYPFVAHFLRDAFNSEPERLQFLEKLSRVLLKALMRRSVCLTEKHQGEVRAFCVLSPIEHMEIPVWDLVTSGALRLLPHVFKKGMLQFIVFYLKDAANAAVPKFIERNQTWYVHLFAVSPNHQGQQLGSVMMRDCVIPYVKQYGGTDILLSTNTEMAFRFYTKNGFEMIAHDQIHSNGEVFEKWSVFQTIREEEV